MKIETRVTVVSAASKRSWLLFALMALVGLQPAPPVRADTDSVQSAADVVAEHAIAQQGLAIALASNVLQSHLLYVSTALGAGPAPDFQGTCGPLDSADNHSGGVEAVAPTPPPGTIPPVVHITLFYDGICTRKYMVADVAVHDAGSGTYSVTNLLTQYYATDGTTPLVQLTSTASATLTQTSLSLHGLGTLVGPAGHGVGASLGLVCASGTVTNTLLCAGGVVQDFPALNAALGSVSPLTLILSQTDSSLTFASTTAAAFRSGAPGSLSLSYMDATDSALAISGGTLYGSNQVTGAAAQFSLFPPPPTGWSSDDTAHDAHFQIAVIDATTRNLALAVTRLSNGAARASANLDQSGSGTISFSDASRAEVRGWVISDSEPDLIFADGFDPPQG